MCGHANKIAAKRAQPRGNPGQNMTRGTPQMTCTDRTRGTPSVNRQTEYITFPQTLNTGGNDPVTPSHLDRAPLVSAILHPPFPCAIHITCIFPCFQI